jgi:hypothetical protein
MPPWSPRTSPPGPVVAVVLVHVVVVVFWWQATRHEPPQPKHAQPPALLLRWLPLTVPLTVPLPLPVPQPTAPTERLAPRPVSAPAWPRPPQAIMAPNLPAPPALGTEGPATAAANAPAVAASAAPPPLDLRLPRGRQAESRRRNPALDDPRSNTGAPTLEGKLAQAMGGHATWTEERLDVDRVVFRRGSECIVATRSRAGQLELGGGAFRNAWSVREC